MSDTLLDDDEYRVIAGDGSTDLGHVAIVNVPSDAAGIAWTCFDNPHITGEIDADKAWYLHHLTDVTGR